MGLTLRTVTLDEAARMMRRLAPPGPAWSGSGALAWLRALAGEPRRLINRVADLGLELLGSTASETIVAWGREFGLLDSACVTWPATEAERQALVQAAERAQGGQTPAYFVGIAAGLGVAITITEVPVSPFRCGAGRCGDELATGESAHEWLVTGPAATDGAVQDRLECIFARVKPAHTVVHFSWSA